MLFRSVQGLSVKFEPLAPDTLDGVEHDRIVLEQGKTDLPQTLYVCYHDRTSVDRVFKDFLKALGKYSSQLVRYPEGEPRVLAVCLPDVLVRAAEIERKDKFRPTLKAKFERWLKSQSQNNVNVDLEGLILGEQVISKDYNFNAPEMYLWAVAHGRSSLFDDVIVPLTGTGTGRGK